MIKSQLNDQALPPDREGGQCRRKLACGQVDLMTDATTCDRSIMQSTLMRQQPSKLLVEVATR